MRRHKKNKCLINSNKIKKVRKRINNRVNKQNRNKSKQF